MAASIYFVIGFFERGGATVIANEVITDQVKIQNLSNYPIMMRLSTSGSKVIPQNYRVWKILGSKCWTTTNSNGQFNQDLKMVQCDINKHFGCYRSLFEDMKDIETFICPEYPTDSDLNGLYGGTKPYSFFNFAFRPCINELDNNVCENSTYIKGFLNQVFLDIRSVDFSISNFDASPAMPVGKGDRFSVSQTIFRRIWMNFKNIQYTTDIGYLFTNTQTDNFHVLESYSSEMDLRDQKTNVTPFTFLWLTLVNSSHKINYFRSYMKLQNLIANIGGVIKGLILIATLINSFIS